MKTLTLVIGDKNLSSWSMRPWLALKHSALPFKEKQILLDRPNSKSKILKHSPSGRVPVLKHGGLTIWDSLAICEYVAELAPRLWPEDAAVRARARSYVSEMHSGFPALRSQMSMDIALRYQLNHLTPETILDIRRIVELWRTAMVRSGGPYLFGDFSIADAFYAPVVMRFQSYKITIKDARCRDYVQTILSNSHVRDWVKHAMREKPVSVIF